MDESKKSPTNFAITELGIRPYRWQAQCLEAIALQPSTRLPVAVAAANGSGKTTAIVAVAVAWFFHCYPRGKVVITSGSFNQLQNQLWPALESLSRGQWHVTRGSSPLGVTTREGGRAIGFSTSDAMRAEGWHPTIGPDVDPVFIIVDEAKNVADEIFHAFQRCTRKYQLWVSSPGPAWGKFYDAFAAHSALFWTRRVTSQECPHIPREKIERDCMELGEAHPVYRSMHLAEFTDLEDRPIIAATALRSAMESPPEIDLRGEVVAFCDFAAGGDENVLAVRRGNEVRIVRAWRDHDPVQAARDFVRLFHDQRLHSGEVWGDADGLGCVMIKEIRDCGFHVREFHGGAAAVAEPEHHANLISEVWFLGCREIERGRVNVGSLDPLSFEQLTRRRMERAANGKLRAEPKQDMRSRGVASPDRADALLGAIMCGARLSGAVGGVSFAKPQGGAGFASGVVSGF